VFERVFCGFFIIYKQPCQLSVSVWLNRLFQCTELPHWMQLTLNNMALVGFPVEANPRCPICGPA
jgi:hypothetical protein